MPSSVIGALRVQLGLDSADFEKGLTTAEVRAYKAGEKIGRSLRSVGDTVGTVKNAVAGLGAALAATAFASAAQRAFDYADAIQDLADRTGASTKTIQEFRYAAQLSGSSVESADAALEKFARSQGLAQAGSASMVKLFASLGITSKDYDTALRQLMDGIAKLPTLQQRNAAAMQLMGKSAGDLTNLLGQGSKGFDELAQRANELGVVLRDDVIANAGGANDKLDTLKMILSAQFASAIVQNANSLVSLADSLTKVTKATLDFINSNPERALAIAGAVAGSRAGPLGAAIGGYAGYRAGQALGENSTDPAFRLKRLKEARAAYQSAKDERDAHPLLARAYDGKVTEAAKEVLKQRQLLAGIEQSVKARGASGRRTAGVIETGGGTGGGSSRTSAAAAAKASAAAAARQAEEQRRNDQRFAAEQFRAQNELQDAQADLTASAVERFQFERNRIDREKAVNTQAIQADQNLTDAQKQKLIALEGQIASAKTQLSHEQEAELISRQELERAQARSDSEIEILSAQSGLARTSKQRREIELKILHAQFEQLRIAQQAIIDSRDPNVTALDKENARARLGDLGKLEGLATARTERDTQGPLASYLDSLPRSAAEANEALEAVAAGGVASIVDGLSEAASGARSLGDVFKNVANQIISSLVRIAVQQAVITPLTKALFPSAAATATAVPVAGARAEGGSVVGGRNYFVGEKGVELFTPSTSGRIVPNDELASGGRGPAVVQLVVGEGQMFEPRVVGISGQVSVQTTAASNRAGALRSRQQL